MSVQTHQRVSRKMSLLRRSHEGKGLLTLNSSSRLVRFFSFKGLDSVACTTGSMPSPLQPQPHAMPYHSLQQLRMVANDRQSCSSSSSPVGVWGPVRYNAQMRAVKRLPGSHGPWSAECSETACLCDDTLAKVPCEGRGTWIADRAVQVHHNGSSLTCEPASAVRCGQPTVCLQRVMPLEHIRAHPHQSSVNDNHAESVTRWSLVDVSLEDRWHAHQIDGVLHRSARAGNALRGVKAQRFALVQQRSWCIAFEL